MRVRLLILALVSAGLAGMSAHAQDVKYSFRKSIFFPIPTDRLENLNPKPAKLRLWYAAAGQSWKMYSEKAVNNLDQNNGAQRGFLFESPGEGEYEFASQLVYPDGGESPKEGQLKSAWRVVFDTKPPAVTANAVNATGIEWEVRDEYLDPDGVRIEARYRDTNKSWTVVKERLQPRDQYTWNKIPNGYNLEVRVVAKDRAGNEGFSRIMILPNGNGNSGRSLGTGTLGTTGSSIGRDDRFPSTARTSYGDDVPNRPDILYINHPNYDVESKITRITKSGIGKVVLWQRDNDNSWKQVGEDPNYIPYEKQDAMVRIPYVFQKEGLQEFRVIPWSKATIDRNEKIEGPRKEDRGQILVMYDVTKPTVVIKNVRVMNGNTGIPRLEIDYAASDQNLITDNPVTLEWRGEKQTNWQTITRTKSSGVYNWDNLPDNEWKILIRARAQDKASNEGSADYKEPIILDMERPEATIERIERTGSGGTTRNDPALENRPPPGSGTPVKTSDIIGIPGLPGVPK
jgi:hypothetical protein